MARKHPTVYVVVLVGGKGKRLRPLSTTALPKAFLSVTKDRKTMFRKTLDRIRRLVPDENIIVVANRAHTKLVKRDFPDIGKDNLIREPVSRNTAPAIALAASILERRDPDAIMAVLPTDQYITDERKYILPIKRAVNFIRDNPDAIIAMGTKPRYPSVHFGYIKVRGGRIAKAQKFVEKPDRRRAEKYLKSGCYLWNAGAFVFKASTILRSLKMFAPDVYNSIVSCGSLCVAYRKSPNISIDYAVMEKARNVYCVRADYEWHDLGGFENLIKILTREARDFELKGGKVVNIK